MENKDSKTRIKKIFKKGNQALKILLGFVDKTKELALSFISKMLDYLKNTGLFIIGIFMWPPVLIKKGTLFLWEFGKNIWINIKKSFYNALGVLVAVFCVCLAALFIIATVVHFNPSFINVLNSQYIIAEDNYNQETISMLNQFISQGKIISASEVYNHMLEYYNVLITILIALIGIFGFVSWISIQAKIKHEAELSVENKFETRDFQCRIEKEVEKVAVVVAQATANKILNDDEYISQIANKNAERILQKILNSNTFLSEIKEIIQKNKDDEKIELKPLDGVDDGD